MALKEWQVITDADVDRDSPVTEGLIDKFHNNQEVLISVPVLIDLYENGARKFGYLDTETSVSYVPHGETTLLIPEFCGTLDGDVELVFAFLASVNNASGNGDVRARLAGGTWRNVSVTTQTIRTIHTLRLLTTEVRAAAGTEALLEVQARVVSPVTSMALESAPGLHRFERVV